ncbi:MAG: choice-of-anchor E domain-containing protein [Planctomycetia bacterium]|nr:choice-of-anchor E domain-containing protein [Planctomycetia bacterium]
MTRPPRRSYALELECLEDRRLLAGNIISGFVFEDLNGNGIRDTNEPSVANSIIELKNASGKVAGTTTTDQYGYYQFSTDSSLGSAIQSQSQTLNFFNTSMNSIRAQALQQFNPSLGTLQSVEIKLNGQIVSSIKAENKSSSPVTLTGSVAGTMLLNGPGFNLNLQISPSAVTAHSLAAFDGSINYAGGSGITLGNQSASGIQTQTLTGNAVNAFIGNESVNLSFLAQSNIQVTGGSNLASNISSLGNAEITVTYRYLTASPLKAGKYTMTQKSQPAGLLDGRESQANTVVANSQKTDSISVVLGTSNSSNNNFGEYRPVAISGKVYHDSNNNGQIDATEQFFANVQVKLTGTNDLGKKLTLLTTTDAQGNYQFGNLRPGNYSLAQMSQPAGYVSGKVTPGSLGGTAGTKKDISSIMISGSQQGTSYNFGLNAKSATGIPSSTPVQPSNGSTSGGGSTGIGKGVLLGSTPIRPPSSGGSTPGAIGKGLLLGSTPVVQPPSSVTPTPPSSAGGSLGKGLLLGSTPIRPPSSGGSSSAAIGKGLLLGSSFK